MSLFPFGEGAAKRATRAGWVLFALLVSTPASALSSDVPTPAGWTEGTRNKDLIAFYRENTAAKARDVLAYTEVDAPPQAVFAVVTDFDHWAEFMPYIKQSHILSRPTPDEMIIFQLMSAPLISQRDYYLHVHTTAGTPENGGVYKSAWTSIPEYAPEQKDIVRMRINEGSWAFEPLDGGKRTRIVYSLLSNPAGAIPKWMVDMTSMSIIPNLFDAVRKRVKK